jgi:hypothetical protein
MLRCWHRCHHGQKAGHTSKQHTAVASCSDQQQLITDAGHTLIATHCSKECTTLHTVGPAAGAPFMPRPWWHMSGCLFWLCPPAQACQQQGWMDGRQDQGDAWC